MKKSCVYLTALAAAVATFNVSAAGPKGAIDAYYVVSPEIEVDLDGVGEATFDEGDGIGVKGRFQLDPTLFIAGEYQANEYDEIEGIEVDAQFDQLRGGIGVRFGESSPFYALAEVINAEIEIDNESDDETGYGLHLGLNAPLGDRASVYGQVGYVDVDGDGPEFLVGAAVQFTDTFGLFIDYRHTTLDSDDVEFTFSDLRAGLRVALN